MKDRTSAFVPTDARCAGVTPGTFGTRLGQQPVGTPWVTRTAEGRRSRRRPRTAVEQLCPDDQMLLHTDGVTQFRRLGEEYGRTRLVADLEAVLADGLPPPEVVRALINRVREWRGALPRDNATIVIAEWRTSQMAAS